MAEQLQRHVLEGERGAMEQFEHPLLMVQLDQRRDGLMAEPGIGGRAQVAQFVFAERSGNERSHDPNGGFDIGEAGHRANLVGGEGRPLRGQVKAAIRRQPRQRHILKPERGRAPPGALILHDG